MKIALHRCLSGGVLSASLLFSSCPAMAEPIAVKQTQGSSRGFLMVRAENGAVIGSGDVIQVAHGERVRSQLVFHFLDGSVDDDVTNYTQGKTFHFVSDHHVQRGPFFSKPMDMTVTADGRVTSRSVDKDGKTKVDVKQLELPADVMNGMVVPLLLNVAPDAPEFRLSMVAPVEKGRLIKLAIAPDGIGEFTDTGLGRKAQIFRVKVELGGVVGVVAPLVGKQPGDVLVWVFEGPAPTVVRVVGPLAEGGPVVSVELSGASFKPISAAR